MKQGFLAIGAVLVVGFLPLDHAAATNQMVLEGKASFHHQMVNIDPKVKPNGKHISRPGSLEFVLESEGQELWIVSESFSPNSYQVWYSIKNRPW